MHGVIQTGTSTIYKIVWEASKNELKNTYLIRLRYYEKDTTATHQASYYGSWIQVGDEIIGDYSSTAQTITINQNEDRLFYSGSIEIEASSIEENTFLFNAGHYRYDGVRRGKVYDYVTLPPIGNTKIKKNSVWKTVLAWIKKNGLWKRCIVWKKINGVWKK